MQGSSSFKQLSRRHFLGAAAGTVAAARFMPEAYAQSGAGISELPDIPDEAVGRPFPEAELQLPDEPGKRLGWCVVGLGSFALNQVIPAIQRSQHCKLTGLVSGNADKASRIAADYGVPETGIYSYERFSDISDNDEIDIVYIVLPNGLHAEYTIRAFEAGKHVMCEKPMANSSEECQQMIDAGRKAERKLMIAYRAHFEPHNIRAREMLRAGQFGDVRFLSGDTQRPLDLSRPRDQWRVLRDLAGGGSLVDIGIYALNGVLFFLDAMPTSLVASISTPPDDPRFQQVEDLVTTQLRFESGAIANLSSSYTMMENRVELLGTHGAGLLNPATSYAGNELFEIGKEGIRRVAVDGTSALQFTGEIDHLSLCVMNDKEPKTPGEMGLRDYRLIEAIYRSAESGNWIELNGDGTMKS